MGGFQVVEVKILVGSEAMTALRPVCQLDDISASRLLAAISYAGSCFPCFLEHRPIHHLYHDSLLSHLFTLVLVR